MRFSRMTVSILLICLSRLNAGQAPFVDHQPHNFGGLTSDSMGFEEPGAPVYYQYIADDFQLVMQNMVQQIVFWGFYNSNVEPVGNETLRVRFYNARPDDMLPGDVLYEQSFLNVPRVWTGRNVIAAAGGKEYRYDVLLDQPFDIEADTKYWLEIAQIGDPASSFRWEDSVVPGPANGLAYLNANAPDWAFYDLPLTDPNAAFQLYSTPEPSAFSVLALFVCTYLARRRHSIFEGQLSFYY